MTSVKWTDVIRKALIDAMMNEVIKGSFVDNGFKTTSWKIIQAEFYNKTGLNFTAQQLQSQQSLLKKKYNTFCKLKANSGFGWDERSQLSTALPSVWTAYTDAHPNEKEFQFKTLPFFDELDFIFSGKVATGRFASASVLTPSDPNHSSNRLKRPFDAHDEIAIDLSADNRPGKILKRNNIQDVAASLDCLVKKICQDPKDAVDIKQTVIANALHIFKDSFAHSYNVSEHVMLMIL